MQGIFFGLPRSGKTSTKKRLTGQKPSLEQPSTGVAEEVTRVEIEGQQPILEQPSTGVAEEVTRVEMEDIEKTTVQLLSPSIWNEVTDLSEEAAIVVEDVTTHFTQDRESSVASRKLVKQIMKSQATAPIPNVIQRIIRKAKKKFVQKSNAVDIVPPSADIEHTPQEESITASSDPMEILGFALQKSAIVKHQGRILQFTLYISDAGGQPEFQESLPALVSGPSVYFLTFPLHKGLNEKIPVEYQHPSGRSIIPFEASCTTKEILLSSLASIASTRSYIKLEDGKPVTPKVLFHRHAQG